MKEKGKPSGANKQEGTGVPSEVRAKQKGAGKYVDESNELKDNVKERHPNRNTEKNDATNAGGYKQ
jgi:hypothetical protein